MNIKSGLLFLLAVSPLFLSSYFLHLKEPPVWPDEPVLYDTARNLLDKGVIATNIYGGEVKGLEKRALWYPPVFFYAYAGWIKIADNSIENLRMFPFLLGVISLLVFYLILKIIFPGERKIIFAGLLFLNLDWSFLMAASIARMDMLVFLFINLAILAMLHRRLWITGIFCALAILSHPIGIIALLISLLMSPASPMSPMGPMNPVNEKLKRVYLVLLPVVLGVSVWLLSNLGYLGLMKEQVAFQLSKKAVNEYSFPVLFNLLPHFRLRIMTVLMLFIVFLHKIWRNRSKYDLLILSGLIISAVLVIPGKDFWYLLFLEPFSVLLMMASLKHLSHTRIKPGYFIPYVVMAALFLFHLYFLYSEIKMNTLKSFDYYSYSKAIEKLLPRKGSVLTGNIPDPYFGLMKTGLTLYEVPYNDLPRENFLKLLDKTDYLILNMKPDNVLYRYIILNTEKKTEMKEFGVYNTAVFKFVPRGERVGY